MNVEDAGTPVSLTNFRFLSTHEPGELRVVVTVGANTWLHDESLYRVRDSVVDVAVYNVYVPSEFVAQKFSRKLSVNNTD